MFANLLVSQAVIGVFVGLLVAVAIIDVRHLTISNRYCAAIVLLYPVYVLTAPYGVDWVDGAIVGAVALTIGFLLFAMRLAGGGDVKFFAAVSLWAGSHWLAEYVFVTALVGGAFALVLLIHRRLTSKRKASSDVGLATRAAASANVFLGGMLLASSGAASAVATVRGSGFARRRRHHRFESPNPIRKGPSLSGIFHTARRSPLAGSWWPRCCS